jgi:hypothetical protein
MPFISSAEYTYAYANAPVSGGTGTSSNNPAINAIAVQNAGSTSNGWYWIKTSRMPVARQVYCNLTDAGGGWMCVSYSGTKQSATPALRGQFYPCAWSGGAGVLSGQFAVDVMDLWYHNGTNQCSNLLRLATNTVNDTPTVTNSFIAHQCTYTTNAGRLSTTTSGVQGTGVLDPAAILMATTWSAVKGYTLMTTQTTNTASDWMYNAGANFYWNPVLPSTDSNSIRSGSGTGIGGWMRTQDRDSWGLANVASNVGSSGSSFAGNTLAVFVR